MTKVIEIKEETCFLCNDGYGTHNGGPVPVAVGQSPYGYPVCESHYKSDLWEFTTDYS